MTSVSFTMVDLFDYEAQMARDSLAEPQDLLTRDRALRPSLSRGERTVTLRSWSRTLASTENSRPGQLIQKSYDVLALIAILLGCTSGLGFIHTLLQYDGSQPVNVIPILAIYAALQIFLIINYIFKALVYRLFKRLPGGALIFFLREAAQRWLQRRGPLLAGGAPPQPIFTALMRRLSLLHRHLLQNHGWKLFQDFGIACHATSLCTFIAMIFFNDYTFGWRTTLHLRPETLHAIVETLACPFSWLGDVTAPSLGVLQNSQFSRFQKGFIPQQALDFGARSTAAWWPFLALVIATYGLLPRIVLWTILHCSIKRELRDLAFDDFESEALWQRLTEEQTSWNSHGSLELPRVPSAQALHDQRVRYQRDCIVLRWRDMPIDDGALKECLAREWALSAIGIIDAKGLDREVAGIVGPFKSRDDLILVVAADPWELPGEAIDKIRHGLRAQGNKNTLMLFAPMEALGDRAHAAATADQTAWKHALQTFRDPYLGLLSAGEIS